MKTVTRLLLLILAVGMITGCATTPVKTIENLKAAYNGESTASAKYASFAKGETYEIETMYPGFITVAGTEKSKDAVKSFTWALDTEKKHQLFYKTALSALNSGGEKNLPVKWFVCPVCGNTYDAGTLTAKCDFCMTPKEKFIAF